MKIFGILFFLITFAKASAGAGEVQIIGGVDAGTSAGPTGSVIGALRSAGTDLEGSAKNQTSIVPFFRPLEPGSMLIDTEARALYFVLDGKKAIRYPVGVGREGKEWSGTNRITNKREWPDWRPPPQMIERELERGIVIPEFVKGGVKNPLGARALYIGHTEFRIHGTTQPNSIGRAVSSGCIRMHNKHVIDLYRRVKVGAVVVVE